MGPEPSLKLNPMQIKESPQVYDAIIVGSGAGGGMATNILAEAGLKGAQLNVAINLADIHDPIFVGETQEDLRRVVSGTDQEKERVFAYVLEHT